MIHLFHKKQKIGTEKEIQKAIKQEQKKIDKLQPKVDKLHEKLQEREAKSREYRELMSQSKDWKESSKLSRLNIKSNRVYAEIKKKYLALDHQLQFAIRNIIRFEELLDEKQGKAEQKNESFHYEEALEQLRKEKEERIQLVQQESSMINPS